MDWNAWSYLIFGSTLVATFLWIILHYYMPKRKKKVEEPKYKMLDDDDE